VKRLARPALQFRGMRHEGARRAGNPFAPGRDRRPDWALTALGALDGAWLAQRGSQAEMSQYTRNSRYDLTVRIDAIHRVSGYVPGGPAARFPGEEP
jgi:hypothetical protein